VGDREQTDSTSATRWCCGLAVAGCISLYSGNKRVEAFLVSVAGLVYVLFIICFYLLVTVFDLWLPSIFNRDKRPNGFLSSKPMQSCVSKGYSDWTVMYLSFLPHLIPDQVHKCELKLWCFQAVKCK
jgi:hypothetical protein